MRCSLIRHSAWTSCRSVSTYSRCTRSLATRRAAADRVRSRSCTRHPRAGGRGGPHQRPHTGRCNGRHGAARRGGRGGRRRRVPQRWTVGDRGGGLRHGDGAQGGHGLRTWQSLDDRRETGAPSVHPHRHVGGPAKHRHRRRPAGRRGARGGPTCRRRSNAIQRRGSTCSCTLPRTPEPRGSNEWRRHCATRPRACPVARPCWGGWTTEAVVAEATRPIWGDLVHTLSPELLLLQTRSIVRPS